ncbi:MAG: NTP transferase domain-containing protein [candidate division Zixibacteria bacterium]|nr:NTP transferase domain-containing protein [candidate division Zixibacteria bacterium]
MHMTMAVAPRAIVTTMPPAVILAAGEGLRLNGKNGGMSKPLTPVLGLTLLERAILSCREVGVTQFYVVLGYRAGAMISYLRALKKREHVLIQPVMNSNWNEGNGSSTLAVAPYIDGPFFLLMCDHLFDPAILQCLLDAEENTAGCLLAVDRRMDYVLDLEDATKVRLDGTAITAIGKGMASFDAIDTGLFLCDPTLFNALRNARHNGHASLSAGIMELVESREARAVSIGNRFWLDVDTPKDLSYAKRRLLERLSKPDDDGLVARYLNRPVSRKISALLVRTSITPNGISLMSFAICVIGAFIFSFGEFVFAVVAGLMVQMASILDGCDGEVARLKFQSSCFGAWFDTILDRYADVAIVAGVTYGFWLNHPYPTVWLGAVFALTGFIMASYVKKEFTIRFRSRPPDGLFGRLIKRDMRIFVIMLGALVNQPYEAMILIGLLSHVGIGWMLLKGHRQIV